MKEKKKIKYNMFLIGGPKGVGKTTLTGAISFDLGIERVETGKIVLDYLSLESNLSLNDFISQRLLEWDRDILVDTHYVAFPHKEGMDTSFKRCLDKNHLQDMAGKYDIHLSHLILDKTSLLERRLRDERPRINSEDLVQLEIKNSFKACKQYSEDLGKPVYELINKNKKVSKILLESWILKITNYKDIGS